jgi:hypothetical protein
LASEITAPRRGFLEEEKDEDEDSDIYHQIKLKFNKIKIKVEIIDKIIIKINSKFKKINKFKDSHNSIIIINYLVGSAVMSVLEGEENHEIFINRGCDFHKSTEPKKHLGATTSLHLSQHIFSQLKLS